MSPHDRERLSAWVDGELSPREREVLEAHLAECRACAEEAARLAALDAAARDLPVEAPPGYFESLPSRVRGRLTPRPGRRPPHVLPVWSWVAAAALLLAVVTPVTLRRLRPPEAPPAAAARVTGAPAMRPAPVRTPVPVESEPPRGPEGPASGVSEEAAARRPQKTSEGSHASANETRRQAETTEPAVPPPPAPSLAREEAFASAPEARKPAAASAPALAADAGVAVGTAAAVPETEASKAREVSGLTEELRDRVQESKGAASRPAGRAPLSAASAEAPTPLAKKGEAGAAEERFRRLDAQRPQDVEGWRRLRAAWRAFAESFPESDYADEGRVRSIEAGFQAWTKSHSEEDRRVLDRDVAAYLSRRDALQKARVRHLARLP